MDMETKQRLVLLIASGVKDYQSIRKRLPQVIDSEFSHLVFAPDESDRLLREKNPHPHSQCEPYEFHPEDEFILSDTGKDILHQYQQEQDLRRMQRWSLYFAAIAALLSGLSVILSVLQWLSTD